MTTETKMTAAEIERACRQYANEDLELAQAEGMISITGTRLGVVDLLFDTDSQRFGVRVAATMGPTEFNMARGVAAIWLAGIYTVVQ